MRGNQNGAEVFLTNFRSLRSLQENIIYLQLQLPLSLFLNYGGNSENLT